MKISDFILSVGTNYIRKDGGDWETFDTKFEGCVEAFNLKMVYGNKPAAIICCYGQSMCTRLFIETLVLSEEYKDLAYLIVVDSSEKEYTRDIVRNYFVNRSGYLVSIKTRATHSQAMNIASKLNLFKNVKFIQFLDNDMEYLRRGLSVRLIEDMIKHKPQAQLCGHYLDTRAATYYHKPITAAPVFSAGFMVRKDFWYKRIKHDCAIRVDLNNNMYYDTWAYMWAQEPKPICFGVDYVKDYLKHWGGQTANRSGISKRIDYIEDRHNKIYNRLLELGVIKERLFDDCC